MRKADVYTKMENLTSSENFLRSQKKFNLSKCLCSTLLNENVAKKVSHLLLKPYSMKIAHPK